MGRQSQKELFKNVWQKRKHFCQVCKRFLGHIPKTFFFAHILSKGAYPRYKFLEENIILLCRDCHYKYDFQGGCKEDERFRGLLQRKQELKEQYYRDEKG
jgi:5-methylcytosine-specific restriction endonuclease McrA|tara:strand:+ start:673 stop:972 length:300 start_codon:yes stop_codon:yes gene_type:complete